MPDDDAEMDRLVNAMLEQLVASRVFSRTVERLSTARLQEMRRAVDAELAGRMAPHEDLRDGKAGRT